MDCVALIMAAGSGQRAGAGVPKQYRRLGGEPVLRRTIAAFAGMAVRVVIDPSHRGLFDEAVGASEPIAGGASRQESVLRGLEALASDAPRHVLIHDAARPLVSAAVIARVQAALESHDGAVAALPITDTVHRVEVPRIEQVARAGLWRAQTPQGFRFDAILAAHRAAAGLGLTDDAAVAARAGLSVAMVEGSEDNIKITTDEDFGRAEQLLSARLSDVRVGSGFDVHRFGPGDHVMLCGVRIAHEAGLLGHSDADAGLHALTDAILGAIAAGDIGQHFPPSDARWKGADSAQFLAHAAGLVAARGGIIGHIDVTLVCERPRIGPHRTEMAERIAAILGIGATRVGIKATTTEGLGFTGRGEGIAAQATATIRLPW